MADGATGCPYPIDKRASNDGLPLSCGAPVRFMNECYQMYSLRFAFLIEGVYALSILSLATMRKAYALHRHAGLMPNGTHRLGQMVEVVKTVVVADKGRQVLGPRSKDK